MPWVLAGLASGVLGLTNTLAIRKGPTAVVGEAMSVPARQACGRERNRSASCRIPITLNKKGARCEIRFPDAAGNPYLTFSAMLMAGLDGIKNKISPGKPLDEDLYALPEDKVKNIPTVCGSLREAMESLDRDRGFLKQGGVFTDDQIDAFIALKFEEIYNLEHTPHPMEFEMYYSS